MNICKRKIIFVFTFAIITFLISLGITKSYALENTYNGFEVAGNIEISKISIDMPILKNATAASLETSVVLIYEDGINQIGNNVIMGHNYKNGTFFSNLSQLEVGDVITITDMQDREIRYNIYNIDTTTPTDTTYYERDTHGKREITLVTTTDDNSGRIVVCAIEDACLEHNFSNEWMTNTNYHWHNCINEGCLEQDSLGIHDSKILKNAVEPTFDTDGYTGDRFCSVCGYQMSVGSFIPAGKYIIESKATMTPAVLIAGRTPNNYTITSAEPSKYTVTVDAWWDLTTNEEITSSTELIADHEYRITLFFEAVENYEYDETNLHYSSMFYMVGKDGIFHNVSILFTTMTSQSATYRKYDATCVDESKLPKHTITINPNNGKDKMQDVSGIAHASVWKIGKPSDYNIQTPSCYEFIGWKIEDKIYQPEETYMVTSEIKVTAQWKEIDHTTNKYITTKINKATDLKNGSIIKTIETKCEKCGMLFDTKKETTVIAGIKTITLSKIKYTYNKKVQKPTVTVKDSNGKVLKNGTDYTVAYSNKNSKKIGQYTVTITFKGNYTGTKNLTYKINPKGVSLKKLTKGSKQFKATWGKNTTETTGYQIEYSTNKNFKNGNKKVTIKKNKTTSTTVKKLKKNKKYYVRIRTYKTVSGKKYYSGWSKVLNVKTK